MKKFGDDLIIEVSDEIYFVGLDLLAEVFQGTQAEIIQQFIYLPEEDKLKLCKQYEMDAIHYNDIEKIEDHKRLLKMNLTNMKSILQTIPFELYYKDDNLYAVKEFEEQVIYSYDLYEALFKSGFIKDDYDDLAFMGYGDSMDFSKLNEFELWETVVEVLLDMNLCTNLEDEFEL